MTSTLTTLALDYWYVLVAVVVLAAAAGGPIWFWFINEAGQYEKEDPFKTILKVERQEDGMDVLTQDLVFEWKIEDSLIRIVVPAGFPTDYASIPFFLHWWLNPEDQVIKRGAVLHDYLYWLTEYGAQQLADSILRFVMYIEGASWIKRIFVYSALRVFGWIPYLNHRKRKQNERKVFMASVRKLN